jgi:hypothetical protein
MGRVRSLLDSVQFDQAGSSHNCQASKAHRIHMGERRLKVKVGRSYEHYCLDCARKILAADAATLRALVAQLDERLESDRDA